MNRKRNQSGQAFVVTVLMITALLGLAALVLDVGSWFRAHRSLQATADAAALAGAQALPDSPGTATSLANDYANKNLSGLTGLNVNLSAAYVGNDTTQVHVGKPAEGFFSKVFGINSINEGASATARTAGMAQAKYVAPIVVKNTHPKLAGTGCPCFGPTNETTLPLDKAGAPGAFDLINLDGSRGGTGPGTLADWMLNGYQNYLGLGDYFSDTGAKFNSSEMQNALTQRIGTELLFPVYDTLTKNGANATYHIIGWVGFHLDGFDISGKGSLTGYFTQVIWTGIQGTSPGAGGPNFGAHSVQLVD